MTGPVTLAQRLAAGEYVMIRTRGVSMQPLLYEGRSHVIVAPVRGELPVGALPLFRVEDGSYRIHRILAVGSGVYFTRGDNCLTGETVPREQVVGQVVEICRFGRTIRLDGLPYRLYARLWPQLHFLIRLRFAWLRLRSRLGRRQSF